MYVNVVSHVNDPDQLFWQELIFGPSTSVGDHIENLVLLDYFQNLNLMNVISVASTTINLEI